MASFLKIHPKKVFFGHLVEQIKEMKILRNLKKIRLIIIFIHGDNKRTTYIPQTNSRPEFRQDQGYYSLLKQLHKNIGKDG